ncbi:heterokaryon incompatibility protein [Fusarium heterosporum]|uniref:Heterokaryon incompatibility protein n=1 Tax=Fusarium heterosporum TaxID=42747 RepID=A0A8H5SYK3_FUSHE|nr:heterokaryon incompatibility protein [Fusarium heterosporum]
MYPVSLYTSLDVSDPLIRLLILQPGELGDRIEGNILVVNLDDRPSYEALSYVWGDSTLELTVTVAGQPVAVTDNLHAALRHVRYTDRERVLWVDALCIHQHDVKEKTRQVGMMGRIYKDSQQCIVWLGETSINETLGFTTEDVRAAFDMISLIAEGDLEGGLPVNLSTGTARKAATSALSGMMLRKNKWWLRIWTIQEAVLTGQKTIVWGTASISWAKCVEAAKELAGPWEQGHKVVDLLSPELFSWDVNEFVTPFISLEFTKEDALPLFTAHRWRYREATDPRDKVYGLVGLVNQAHIPSINCDYALSTATVFTKFTLDMLRSERSLSPLLGWRGEPHATPGLPTWVLDMVRPSPLVNWGCKFWEHYDRYRFFGTDGSSELVLDTLCNESVLCLKGIIVDTVCLVDKGIAVDERVILPNEDFVRVIERRQKILKEFIDASPETLVTDNDWKNAFWRTMIGDALTYDERVTRRAVSEDASLFDQFLNSYEWNDAAESLRSMVLNQSFFITKSGYLGIGPPHIRDGDVVSVLLGSRVPFILRPAQGDMTKIGGRNGFSFIGDSYVHGIMDGELFPSSEDKIRDVLLF